MDFDNVLTSNAMFIKEYLAHKEIPIEEAEPMVTYFRIYEKEGKLLAHHSIPPLELGDEDPEMWSTLINHKLHNQDLPNFMFFGICEIEEEDLLFVVCYFGGEGKIESRLFDLELKDMSEFDVKDAFPNFDIIDFSKADIAH